MGLDMYLSKKTYVKNWEHTQPNDRTHVEVTKNGVPISHIIPSRVSYIEEEVCYWRKANQIHKFFVDEVQNGEDDGGEFRVSQENITDLLDRCKKILTASKLVKGKIKNGYTFKDGKEEAIMEDGKYIKDATVAGKLLPTQEGFFFGSTDYDEYYLQDIKYTADTLGKLTPDDMEQEFYYHASW